MSSTTIIACISSALHDSELFLSDANYGYALQLLQDSELFMNEHVFEGLNISLGILKTFVLCGKKLLNDADFKQFLVRVEAKLQKKAAKLHGFCEASYALPVAEKFRKYTMSVMEQDMERWYVTMLECPCTPHSVSLEANDILEIITSNLEILVTLFDKFEDMVLLKVQLEFLKSLIHFVTKGGKKAGKDLLAYSETIVINIAYVLFHGVFKSFYDLVEMMSSLRTWAQKMKFADHQVYEIYTQSLSDSKFSEQLLDDDAVLAVKNFLDSLLSNLAQIICQETCSRGWMKYQLRELYERLGALRIIFNQQPLVIYDMESQKEISDAVTDAGVAICSFHQEQVDVSFGHQHLLDKFKSLMSKIAQKPTFNSPRTSSFGFVDSVLEKLMELMSSEAESTAKSYVQTIKVELASIRSTLGKIGELQDERVEVQTLWDRLLEVAFKIESVIDYQVVDPRSNSFPASFESIIEDIGDIKADMLKIEVNEVGRKTHCQLPSLTTPSTPKEIIGFQDEERAILARLRGGPKHLRAIAIVGMPGLGKTTLVKKVYEHSSLSCHFSAKAWCTISQVPDKKNILFDLLKQICPGVSSEDSEHDLADKLRRNLKGKRYLIFLDDIWSTEAWDSLKDSFPNDTKGSRIIYTSRSLNVVPSDILDQKPLVLSPLCEIDSFHLMCSHLFPGKEYGFPPALHDLGMKVVARCGGLPLAIMSVAGVLASVEETAWEGILGSFTFLSGEDSCKYTLEFSYTYLPDYLRPCFLSFGVFREDQEVSVSRLLRLWIAEGFVRKSEKNSLEVVAEQYLNMLIGRSLIMVAQRKSDGRVKTCRIHDLLRDFCLEKARDERFFYLVKGSNELSSFNVTHSLRRLLVDFEALRGRRLYCPRARFLLVRDIEQSNPDISSALEFFKLLKVLDLEQVDVRDDFPTAIEQLVLLAFLAIKGYRFTLPSWLGNLSRLETLIISLSSYHDLLLPDTLWSMQKLKYFYIEIAEQSHGGVLPIDNLDNSPVLYELERFRGVVIERCSMKKQLRKFPNIRKLECILGNRDETVYGGDMYAFPGSSSKLESLNLSGNRLRFVVRFDFSTLTNLKRLRLYDLCLPLEIFSIIGNLPSLEVLKLEKLMFDDPDEHAWEMKSGEFSKLRILHLIRMPLRRWIAGDDHEFDCFQKLVLSECYELEELPCCLESAETLEAIEVNYCSERTKDLVKKIESEQINWGNSDLKITYKQRTDI